MEIMIFILLSINAIASLLIYRKNMEAMTLTSLLLMLLIPLAGAGIVLLFRESVSHKWKFSYDCNEITERKQMNDLMIHPHIDEELNIVPITDAMAVSSNYAKRSMMLSQMKKNLTQNYRVLIGATRDKDTETAHYASALKMEIYSKQQIALQQSRKQYQKNSTVENGLNYLERMNSFIKSGLLSEYEKKMQEDQFCNLVEKLSLDKLSNELFETWIDILLDQQNYEQIKLLWENNKYKKCTEQFLIKVIECSLKTKNHRLFEDVNRYIDQNPEVIISAKVQEQVNFWKHWRQLYAFA